MVTQERGMVDPTDSWARNYEPRRGRGAGTLLMATLLGVGIGLLAAPQPGAKTRKLLLKRLADLSEGMGEGVEEIQDAGSKAGKRVKQRLAKLREEAGEEWEDVEDRWKKTKHRLRDLDEDDESSGVFGKILAVAAGLAATYFLTSERAAPARSRVQERAGDVRRRATDQWEKFQRGGIRGGRETNESRTETRAGSNPSDEAPQAS